MTQFTCVDKDGGSCVFDYECTPNTASTKWEYKITTITPLENDEFFQLTIEKIDSQTARITMITNNDNPSYIAKGIPDALLPIVKKTLSLDVQSSPKKDTNKKIFRTLKATKMWERLVLKKLAHYNSVTDIYNII